MSGRLALTWQSGGWRALVALAVLGLLVSSAHGQQARPRFYIAPLDAVVGLPGAKGTPASPATKGMIDPRGMQFLDDSIAGFLAEQFSVTLRSGYGQAVVGLNQIGEFDVGNPAYQQQACGAGQPGFTADFRKTFAAVLGVSRVSYYVNQFNVTGGASNVQILVPVTWTLRFIHLSSARTVYSRSLTIYTRFEGDARETLAANGRDLRDNIRADLRKAISDDAVRAIGLMVTDAQREFVVNRTSAKVIGMERGYIFLDQGSDTGLERGKTYFPTLGSEEVMLQVAYATTGLAVANVSDLKQAALIKEGATLDFDLAGKGLDSAKPTVMAVPYNGDSLSAEQIRDNALMALITADLGKSAPFNITVNDEEIEGIKTRLRQEVCEKTIFAKLPGFTTSDTSRQAAPDFYLRVLSGSSPTFTASGVGGVTRNSIFLTSVGLSLLDNRSLVRQAVVGSSPYELKVVNGKGLAPSEALEINLKNAALKATESLNRQFRFDVKTVRLASVSGASGGRLTARLSEALTPQERASMRLVRPLTVPKTRRTIYLPLVVDRGGESSDPLTLEVLGDVREGDIALVDPAASQIRPVVVCEGAPQRRFMITQLSAASDAENLMGRVVSVGLKGMRLVESDARFIGSVRRSLKSGFFEDKLAEAERSELCLLPMEVQAGPELQCDASTCNGTGVVGSGVRVFDKGNKVGESLLSARVELKGVPLSGLSAFIGIKAHEFQVQSVSGHISQLSK
jgi:hypothetical protein